MLLCCHGDIILHKMKSFFGTLMASLPIVSKYLPVFFLFSSQHTLDEEKENAANSLTNDNLMQGT